MFLREEIQRLEHQRELAGAIQLEREAHILGFFVFSRGLVVRKVQIRSRRRQITLELDGLVNRIELKENIVLLVQGLTAEFGRILDLSLALFAGDSAFSAESLGFLVLTNRLQSGALLLMRLP